MHFIQGDSLKEAIQNLHAGKAGYALRGLLTRFVAVCNAVAYAHSRGVIHRDLKPSNVMLGKYGETLVVDWGLAKAVGKTLVLGTPDTASDVPILIPHSGDSLAPTQAGSALGTPPYMSPEQAAGRIEDLGPATDIYSLGATLYTLLAGTPPFTSRDTGEVLQQVQKGAWLPIRQVNRDVPAGLAAICHKAMSLRTGNRYGSALGAGGRRGSMAGRSAGASVSGAVVGPQRPVDAAASAVGGRGDSHVVVDSFWLRSGRFLVATAAR